MKISIILNVLFCIIILILSSQLRDTRLELKHRLELCQWQVEYFEATDYAKLLSSTQNDLRACLNELHKL